MMRNAFPNVVRPNVGGASARRLFVSSVLGSCLSALCLLLSLSTLHAAEQYEALVTITNVPVDGNTLTVIGQTRTWTTNAPTSVQIAVTNPIPYATTNLWFSIGANDFTNSAYAALVSTNQIRFFSQAGVAMTASITGGWASVVITTNTINTSYTPQLPLTAIFYAPHRTNMANYIVAGLNSFATTKALDSLLQDPPLTNGQPAGGALSGTYPSPAIAASVTSSLNTAVAALIVSTGTLNTAVAALVTSSNTLNSAVTALQTATGTLQTAVAALQTSTGTLNTAVAALVTASNTLNSAVGTKVTTNASFDALAVFNGELLTNVTANATNAVLWTAGPTDTNAATIAIAVRGSVTNQVSTGTNTFYVLGGGSAMARVVTTNTQPSVVFEPAQTSENLILRWSARCTNAANALIVVTVNGDGGANYDRQNFQASATVVSGVEAFGETTAFIGQAAGDGYTAGLYNMGESVVAFYTNTTFHKVFENRYGRKDGTSSGNLLSFKGNVFWRSTDAVTNLTITISGGAFAAGSVFTLYGQ